MKKAKISLCLSVTLISFTLLFGIFPLAAIAAAGDIDVTFRLVGTDEGGAYTTWIATKDYTVAADSTAAQLFERALADAGITPTFISADWGSYLGAIKAPAILGDFTMGENTVGEYPDAVYSGWMFSVNEVLSPVGMDETALIAGDNVVFFYAYDMNEGIDWATSDASNAPAIAASDVDPATPSPQPSPSSPEPEPQPSAQPENPRTGDNGGATLWIYMGGASLLGLCIIAITGRKEGADV